MLSPVMVGAWQGTFLHYPLLGAEVDDNTVRKEVQCLGHSGHG